MYVSDIIPKAYYDEEQMSYFISITTCLQVLSEPAVPLIVKIQATAALGTDYIIQDVSWFIPLGNGVLSLAC